MSKYEPLYRHLRASDREYLEFSFTDIEEILGFPLPASARRYPAWWSNSDVSHVQAQAWLRADYETTVVDVPGERLRFSSIKRSKGYREMTQAPLSSPDQAAPPHKRHPLFGSMKGTTIVMPGVDLTQPADTDWSRVYDDDYDHGVIVEQQDTKRN
jgi:hypothetical protein